MLDEAAKLEAIRAFDLPERLFADVTPKVVAEWRLLALIESPSHVRRRSESVQVAMLAALTVTRRQEITDALVQLLISTVHRIGLRAEKKVFRQQVAEFRRVGSKESLLLKVADAAVRRPDETVRQVVFPVVGAENLRNLAAEYRAGRSVIQGVADHRGAGVLGVLPQPPGCGHGAGEVAAGRRGGLVEGVAEGPGPGPTRNVTAQHGRRVSQPCRGPGSSVVAGRSRAPPGGPAGRPLFGHRGVHRPSRRGETTAIAHPTVSTRHITAGVVISHTKYDSSRSASRRTEQIYQLTPRVPKYVAKAGRERPPSRPHILPVGRLALIPAPTIAKDARRNPGAAPTTKAALTSPRTSTPSAPDNLAGGANPLRRLGAHRLRWLSVASRRVVRRFQRKTTPSS